MHCSLTIDGRTLRARAGQTVLEVAAEHGIEIPTLCHHPDLRPVGSCRLCVVEVEPRGDLLTACTLPVQEGMVVRTATPNVVEIRREILSLLLQDYADAGYARGDRGPTEFERWLDEYQVRRPPGTSSQLRCPVNNWPVNSDPHPVLWVDTNKCILCKRCVRACADLQGRFVWGVSQRGHRTRLVAGADTDLHTARCEACGTCVAYCPTGALDDKPSVGRGMAERCVRTTCGYCGIGCQMELHVRQQRIIRVTATSESTVNGRQLCVKGRYGYDFVHHPERLVEPLVRRYLLEGRNDRARGDRVRDEWVPVTWDTALNLAAAKFLAIKQESGADAIGVLSSAKCTNEENYLIQKFTRQVIGTHNIDHCARLCHSSSVAAMSVSFGSGAMSNTLSDIAHNARAIFVIGSNTTEQHPVFGAQLRQAVLQRGAKLVVADPRRIDLTEHATLHLRQRPGTDVALLNGLQQIVLEKGWQDQDFIDRRCEGFAEYREALASYTPDRVAEITGVPAKQLQEAAEILALNRPMAAIWSMGITQHTTGVMNALAICNLQMLLGNIGVSGGGVNPLRGQNNVQGACDMGALPDLLPGYRSVRNVEILESFAAAWRTEPLRPSEQAQRADRLDNNPGLTVTEMIGRAGTGQLRGMYIVGENPAMTEPDVNHARQCLEACEFVVLQEIFPSETASAADILLPGASWAEKNGTFTNTERRVQLVAQALTPIGQTRPDWIITQELARRILALEGRGAVGPQAHWDYSEPREILAEIASLTPIYAGISDERLRAGTALHWPVPTHDHPGTPVLHRDSFPRGRGKFHVTQYVRPEECPDDEYPLVLTTGRVLYHWHGGEQTRRASALVKLYPEPLVEICPSDATRFGLSDAASVRVTSRRGEITARAVITERVPPGLVFANFHFPGAQNVNNLTLPSLDPISKIPAYKACAIRIAAD